MIFNDEIYDTFSWSKSDSDLVLKGTNVRATLKDYYVCEHSAKQLKLGNNTYSIAELLEGSATPLSAPRRPMMATANAIIEEVAAWSNSNSGYADISADIVGTDNTSTAANLVSSFVNNQQYFG